VLKFLPAPLVRRVARRGRRRGAAGLLAVALAAAAVAGCSSASGATSPSGVRSGGPGNGIVIGFSQRRVAGSDWYKTLIAGAEAEAEALGAKIQVLDANGDSIQQDQDVQTLLTRGANAIVLNANDPLGVTAAVRAMRQARVPFVEVNSNLAPSLAGQAACYIEEDQVATGAKVGRVIAQDAVKRYGTSANVKLVAVGGVPGDVLSELRWQGFKQGYDSVMAKYPRFRTSVLPFQYGQWLPDQALPLIRDIASANPNLKIVYSESDVMQAGIQHGLQDAGLWNNDILEGSYDGGMNGVQLMVGNPNGQMQADGANVPWDQGAEAVKIVVAVLKGHQKSVCPTGTDLISTPLVTPANARSYYNPGLTHVQVPLSQVKLTYAKTGG
jgi:ribose transport system substrate-binding protein